MSCMNEFEKVLIDSQKEVGKSEEELKQIASNLCKQRGINIDEAYAQFEQQFSGMMGKQNNHGINR